MQSKRQITRNMLAIAVILLSLAYLCSCAASRKMKKESDKQPQADSVDVFIPTHPPIVVPHSWRESGKKIEIKAYHNRNF